MSGKKIIIVGAGLCGSLLAIRLAKKGFDVNLFEKRDDLRKEWVDAGRSINLALSSRGLLALEKAGIKEEILTACIPMKGRMVHTIDGNEFLSPYSGRASDYINSVSRPGLNIALLNQADKFDNVHCHFNARVVDVNLKSATIHYIDGDEKKTDSGDIVIGTDGAGSVIRRGMMARTTELLFNYSQDFLRHGYKELSILPGDAGAWKIEKEALHIWPNGDFMIIALPNLDGSFTLTMFHPFDSTIGFNQLNNAERVEEFFQTYYPTLLPLIPHYKKEFFENPVGTLGTIKCFPWQAFGKCLIMGDASHAIVPFYGQGMNASLEDVRIFMELFEEFGDDWSNLFSKFQEARKADTDAIADLAKDNFFEMRDHVDDLDFKRKRKIEMELERAYPDYSSKYSLVTFQPELSYEKAMIRGRKQDEILLDMCGTSFDENRPLSVYYDQLRQLTFA